MLPWLKIVNEELLFERKANKNANYLERVLKIEGFFIFFNFTPREEGLITNFRNPNLSTIDPYSISCRKTAISMIEKSKHD